MGGGAVLALEQSVLGERTIERRMRSVLGFSLLLMGCSSCRSKETTATTATVATTDRVDAGSPAPVVFSDLGDRAEISLGAGLSLDLHPVGPALIVIDLKEPAKPKWRRIRIERHVLGRDGTKELAELATTRWSHPTHDEHAAEPGTLYAYRAQLDDGAWTAEVNVRVGKPTAPPPKPSKLVAKTDSRYAVTLEWEADTRAAVGFEVDVMEGDATEWSLLAVTNPDEKGFAHNYRLPKMTARYRVATFNANGKSPFVETERVMMPEKDPKPLPVRPPPPCRKDQSKTADVDWEKEAGHGVTTAAAFPDSEFTVRRVTGFYKGCFRDMAAIEVQGDLMAPRPWTDENGYSVLRAVSGAGIYAGTQVRTYAHAYGHYEEVNVALFCGEPYPENTTEPKRPAWPKLDGAMTTWHGPFEKCQRDKFELDERP
jgi:hypothetical protein